MSNPNGNVDDVSYFLDMYHQGESSDGAWSQYNRAAPRNYTPQYETLASGSNAANWEQESNYTTTTDTTDTTRSSRATTVFSKRSMAARSSVSRSTAPQAHWPALADGIPAAGTGNNDYFLWCEFHELKGCNATFRGDDEATWIQHHIRHLKDRFPRELVCWFCDDHPHFVARRDADRQSNFEDRMQHIRQHIYSDWSAFDSMRPDFYMVEHLYRNGRIDKETYDDAMRYTEVPQSLQPPDWDDSRASLGAVCHDLAKEQRHLKKHGGRKGKGH